MWVIFLDEVAPMQRGVGLIGGAGNTAYEKALSAAGNWIAVAKAAQERLGQFYNGGCSAGPACQLFRKGRRARATDADHKDAVTGLGGVELGHGRCRRFSS